MDLDLRSQLNIQLINGGHDKKIQEHLLYTLNAHPNNWPTQVQARALALLRSGEITSFPALLSRILDEVRKETAEAPPPSSNDKQHESNGSAAAATNGNSSSSGGGGGGGSKKANGATAAAAAAAAAAGPGPGEAGNLHQNTSTSLAVPRAAVDEALRVTREALMAVAEFEDGGAGGDGAAAS